MDYEKQLFELKKQKAPDGFVTSTMRFIKLKELEEEQKSTAKIEYSFFKLGQICVVASLLLIILNIFPATKDVHGQDNIPYAFKHENITQKAFQKCEDIIESAKELIDIEIIKKEK